MNRFLAVVAIAQGVAIAVLVFLLASRPVASSEGRSEEIQRAAETDQDELKASEPERRADSPTAEAKRVTTPAQVVADQSLATLLYGRILDAAGAPLKQRVSVYLRQGSAPRGISAQTQAELGYSVVGLAAGTWSMTCRATGFKDHVASVEVSGAPFQRFDVTLSRARVVRVAFVDKDGGRAQQTWAKSRVFVEPAIVATVQEPPDSFPMTSSRSVSRLGVGKWRGRYVGRGDKPLPERFAGTVEIDADGPVWLAVVLRQVVVAKTLVAVEQSEVDIHVPFESIKSKLARATLRVVASESNAPLKGVRVSFTDRQTGGGGRPTDADGKITVENIVPGILELDASCKGRERYHRMLRIHPGDVLDLGVISLDPVQVIEGRVVDAGGKPVSGASLSWFRVGRYGDDVPYDSGYGARSGSDGKFKLWGCGAGRYLVRARHASGVADMFVDSTQTQKPVEIRLGAGTEITIVNQVPRTKTFLVRLLRRGQTVSAWLERPLPTFSKRRMKIPSGKYDVQIRDDARLVRAFALDATKPGATLAVP